MLIIRARLLGEAFKLITESPSKETYLVKLSEIVALTHKIRVLYNEVMKILNMSGVVYIFVIELCR